MGSLIGIGSSSSWSCSSSGFCAGNDVINVAHILHCVRIELSMGDWSDVHLPRHADDISAITGNMFRSGYCRRHLHCGGVSGCKPFAKASQVVLFFHRRAIKHYCSGWGHHCGRDGKGRASSGAMDLHTSMYTVPLLNVGILPILQLMLLPIATFYTVGRFSKSKCKR